MLAARRFRRLACAAILIPALALTGCSGVRKAIDRINNSAASYTDLQNFIQSELTTKFHRSVRSVSCTPHVQQVVPSSTAHLTCVVRFTDGTGYTTPAAIIDSSTDPDIATESFRFGDPPVIDITTAPLPAPTVHLAAGSPRSLFALRNLTRVYRLLKSRFPHYLFIQLAIYPGELEAVLASPGGQARLVRFTGRLIAGPLVSFSGSRNGIDFAQFSPAVIARLNRRISSPISRFVLTTALAHGNSGWTIDPEPGGRRYRALVDGSHLVALPG
jgi:hypothetical protein